MKFYRIKYLHLFLYYIIILHELPMYEDMSFSRFFFLEDDAKYLLYIELNKICFHCFIVLIMLTYRISWKLIVALV